MLRADFRLIETYQYRAEAPLDCPILAIGGDQDEWAHPAELAAWQMQTSSTFRVELFTGGHFYLQEALPQLLDLIAREMLSGVPHEH
jgi:medium-chain acyl-[acyl-carrier-protein] hydrolase